MAKANCEIMKGGIEFLIKLRPGGGESPFVFVPEMSTCRM